MRYIDYDAIDYRNDKMHGKSSDFIDGVIYMAQRIEDAPSIDIVRCQDCKHWRSDGGAMMVCENTDIPTDACDFCSWGEREGE